MKNINTKKLITPPNSSLKNYTGNWRTAKPETDYEKCIGCSFCAKICPEACIGMKMLNSKLKPYTDYDYCKGCGLCAKECPVKAIIMKQDY